MSQMVNHEPNYIRRVIDHVCYIYDARVSILTRVVVIMSQLQTFSSPVASVAAKPAKPMQAGQLG